MAVGDACWFACFLALAWLFVGCALPKGKLSDAQENAADGGVRNSGMRQVTKSPRAAGNGGTADGRGAGGAGGTAAGRGAGGAGGTEMGSSGARGGAAAPDTGKASDAGTKNDASTPTRAPQPKAPGEPCDSNADCANANCKKGWTGDKRCFGTITQGRDCNGEFDCDGYACIPRKHGETQGVCIDTSACAQDRCRQSHALAFCQLDQKCSATPLDFVKCYQAQCLGDGGSDAGCVEESVYQRLNEIGCCPPGDISNGNCGTFPQCGCAADQKCDAVRDKEGRAECGPIGSVEEGGTCATDKECQKGFSCRGHLCKRYCGGPDDDSCPKGACVPGVANKKVEPGVFICTRNCDPTAPTTQNEKYAGCGVGQGCEPASDGNSDCYSTTGTGMQGDSCDDGMGGTDGYKCAPGYSCMLKGARCENYCKVQDGTCSFGICYAFGPSKRYAGSVEIGYCE